MQELFTVDSLISFVILVILEVVLGIDNVIFVSIIMNRLKSVKDQKKGTSPLDDNWHNFAQFTVAGVRLVIRTEG